MKKNSFPRNKNITVRVTATEKFFFEKIAEFNNLSVSTWIYHTVRKEKDSYCEKIISDQVLEIIDEAIISIERVLEKINPEDDLQKFSIQQVADNFILKSSLLLMEIKLKNFKKKLIELKKQAHNVII